MLIERIWLYHMVNILKSNFVSHLKYDLPAGLVVFLVALPLCLGIALASGAPLFSGVIAGIVGGLVVSIFSGSELSVSGPAAGLTVIVLNAIKTLETFEAFLLSVVIAGVLQVVLGFLKAGTIANYFPNSVIKGMLAAIGLILILKQIPHAFGYDPDFEGDHAFFQHNSENTFSGGLHALRHITPGATIISFVSFLVLLLWEHPLLKKIKMVPGPLVVVVLGIIINHIFLLFYPQIYLNDGHLVQLPVASNFAGFFSQFTLPKFSAFGNINIYIIAATLAIVASIETLLSVEAVDKIDPFKRMAATNKELKAQGIGNIISGFLGGLPLTAVIVRSSANVDAGGRTKFASFFHGLLLFLSVLFIPNLINKIPLASLAIVLIFTGYKLAKVSILKKMYKLGWDQFTPFIVTILAILFTDLLKGIAIGMVVGVFYILRDNYKFPYYIEKTKYHSGDKIKIYLSEHVSFLNKASIALTLKHLPKSTEVDIDASNSQYIDLDVLEIIRDFQENAKYRNIKVALTGFKELYKHDGH